MHLHMNSQNCKWYAVASGAIGLPNRGIAEEVSYSNLTTPIPPFCHHQIPASKLQTTSPPKWATI